jgi:hypothetical protein
MRKARAAIISIIVGICVLAATSIANAADVGYTQKVIYDLPDTNYAVGTVPAGSGVTLICYTDQGSTRWFRLTAPTVNLSGQYIGDLTDFMLAGDISNQYNVPPC